MRGDVSNDPHQTFLTPFHAFLPDVDLPHSCLSECDVWHDVFVTCGRQGQHFNHTCLPTICTHSWNHQEDLQDRTDKLWSKKVCPRIARPISRIFEECADICCTLQSLSTKCGCLGKLRNVQPICAHSHRPWRWARNPQGKLFAPQKHMLGG